MKKQCLVRRKAYQKTFQKYGVTPKALQWRNSESAKIRYRNLVADIDFKNKSIQDIGCGFSDLIPFIEYKSKHLTYTGIDVVPEFIREDQRKYPQHSFRVGDWMELIGKSDIILCSGVLNNKIKGNQYAYREKTISLMYKNANEILAFNMAGGFPQPKNRDKYKVYYVNSLKILRYCLGLTNNVIFRHHYRKKDFTIVMFKK